MKDFDPARKGNPFRPLEPGEVAVMKTVSQASQASQVEGKRGKQYRNGRSTSKDAVTTEAPQVTIVSACDFMQKEFPPIQWIVPNIIPEGLTMLAGKPKTGKSFLAVNLAVAVATGGYAMGKVQVDQGRALYINVDSSQREFQQRLRAYDTVPKALDLAFAWPKLDKGGLDALSSYVDDRPDTRLVIVDTFFKVRNAYDQTKRLYDEDYESLEGLAEIARTRGIGVVIIHHANKIRDAEDPFDMISGSTGLTAALDTGIVLRDIPTGTALFVKGKEVAQVDLALTRDEHVGTWVLEGPVESFNFNSVWQQIIDALKDGLRTPRDIADLTKINYDTVRQTLVRMLKEGRLRRVERGQYVLREHFFGPGLSAYDEYPVASGGDVTDPF